MRRQDKGFSLVEVTVVVGLIMIGSAVAVVQMRQSAAAIDADKASNMAIAELRYARQVAVDERRTVNVAFVGSNGITVTRQNGGGSTTLLDSVTLPSGYTFGLPTGVDDTPEAFGNTQPVSFNLGTTGSFLGDGIFVSGAGIVMNGTVFTIGSGNGSARAVTLTGASGRMKQYYVQGTKWVERR
ncbi:MAG TPA: prepilin-type N-terminal cleavage/methylation domain-containing protein [Terriglobia bacterium]|nr:prepilin-type N-terminal cleavage/methylation domain-containing protein [Terriglobia bacterium]